MYLPTPKNLADLDACADQHNLWAALFFDGDLESSKQVLWTAERLQDCADKGVDLGWGFERGLGSSLPRALALTDPYCAYLYACYVDKGPRDDTRQAALTDSYCAYLYARDVDRAPRDDTRQAVLRGHRVSYWYARDVDRGPRDDTRQAVLDDPSHAYIYALDVDKGPHDDTRQAASRDPGYATMYARYVNPLA